MADIHSRALLETCLEELRSIRDLDRKRTETILSAIEQIRRGVETMLSHCLSSSAWNASTRRS